jgi:predicted NAD/FAD-binding protein
MLGEQVAKDGRIRVALVGSGMAGLSAAWLLSKDERFEVHLFEAYNQPGLSAHSVPVKNPETGEQVDVDIPLRIGMFHGVRSACLYRSLKP